MKNLEEAITLLGIPPDIWVGNVTVFFWDQRWRLPYRWYEFKVHRGHNYGFSAMLFGAAVMCVRVAQTEAPRP